MEDAHGITAPQFLCLHALDRTGSLTHNEPAREVRLLDSTVASINDRMEAKGLVTRRRDIEDRRRVHVAATAAGRGSDVPPSPPSAASSGS